MKYLIFLSLLSNLSVAADDGAKLRDSLEREIEKLDPEVIRLRNLEQLKKKRDSLRDEKENLQAQVGNESPSTLNRDIESLKSEISRLKPISELATRKRQLASEKKALMENIYSTDR